MESANDDSKLAELQHEVCLKMIHKALTQNEVIGKIVGEIEQLGCSIPENFFKCMQEEGSQKRGLGGFTVPTGNDEIYKPQIIIFENNIRSKSMLETTLQHELIHAYDICKGKVDYKNCSHHACTEVRASNLSGECDWVQEMFRGHLAFRGGKMDCVKRRATLSVEANPHCRGYGKAAVEKVFDTAYSDISPLSEADV